ncbi:MAG TPA: FHA domain-containing protein [Aggregatilineaceae bacterium]|nr:FHA domain-containing protein [Aggregatilineaceae bacterium]
MSDEWRICFMCQGRNAADAAVCVRCGAILNPETIPVEEEAKRTINTNPLTLPPQLMLYVAGSAQPFIINNQHEIVLGRAIPGTPPPTVDLSSLNAHLMGVSRRHATIRAHGNGKWTLADMGSSNGTWLNGTRLKLGQVETLHDGDQIRLGQLAILFFSAPVHMLYLGESDYAPLRHGTITPDYMSQRLLPYLRAVIQGQHMVDEMLGRRMAEIGMRSLTVVVPDTIVIHLENALEIVQFIREMLPNWSKQYAEVLKTYPDETSIPPEMIQDQNRIIGIWVKQLAPHLSSDEQATYTSKLTAPMHQILFSSYAVSPATFV